MSVEHYDKTIALSDLYRDIFGSEKGRAVLLDMIEKAGIYEQPPRSLSAEDRAYLDGYKAAVLRIVEYAEMTAAEMQLLYRRRNQVAAAEAMQSLDA